MGKAPPDHDFLEQALLRVVKDTQRVKSLVANLFDSGQILGGVSSERFDAYTIPIIVAFPDICELSRSESDITLL